MKNKMAIPLIILFFTSISFVEKANSYHPCHSLFKKSAKHDSKVLINSSESSSENTHNRDFGVLGTSINHGQPHKGTEKAYTSLEETGFWGSIGIPYRNFGILPFKNSFSIYRDLYEKTLEIMDRGFRPVLVGGDHSQSFATISALLTRHPDVKIIWVDAHTDINTHLTSPSGNIHGMPVAGLMGLAHKNSWKMPWLNQSLASDSIIYIGIRDMDPGEVKLVKKHGIEIYTAEQIHNGDLNSILSRISEKWKGKKVHVSFDIDALDSSLVPATGTSVRDGLTMEQASIIIEWIKKDFRLISLEVVEFNPDLAKTEMELETTRHHTQELIRRVYGIP